MELTALTERLDEVLDIAAYDDVDASRNGLQVTRQHEEIETVAFAVDAAVEPIEAAAAANADALVVHHGIMWDGLGRLTGHRYDRVCALLEHDLALYAAHLPLDGHQVHGNAAGIADYLDLGSREPAPTLGEQPIGVIGDLPDKLTVGELRETLAERLPVSAGEITTFGDGPSQPTTVAIVTGSGTDFLEEVAEAGADLLLTGEAKQAAYHRAAELDVTVLAAGHYATETVGVRTLAAVVEEWGPETTFVDVPTGL